MSFCPGEHAWPNTSRELFEAREKVRSYRCCPDSRDHEDVRPPRKASTERPPHGVEQLTGRLSPYNSSGIKKQVRSRKDPCCKPPERGPAPVCKDIVLPNPDSRRSFDPWSSGPSRPCYRKKTRVGVYVGVAPLPETRPLDEETTKPWDNDTWIPYGGIFLQYTP